MKTSISPPWEKLSGTLDKVVYSNNAHGPYSKKYYKPTGTPTSFQEQFKSNFKSLSERWNIISESQRILWNNFAKELTYTNYNGRPTHPSGQNTFIKCNSNLNLIGQFPIDQPGAIFPFNCPYHLNISLGPGGNGIIIDFLTPSYTGSGVNAIYITDHLSPGIFYTKCEFRYIKYEAIISHPSSISNIEMTNRFGHPFHSAKKYFVKFVCIDSLTGLASVPVKSSYIFP